jgi:transposase
LERLDEVRFAAVKGGELEMAVAITRTELDAAGLRAAAARSKNVAASRRMLTLALVLEGGNRTEAARAAGMDRQTLRGWAHRYNEAGLDGLQNKPNPGAPPRKLTAEQEAAVAAWVRQGPTLEQHNVVRWRLVDLRDEIDLCFGAQLHEPTMGKLMVRLNFSRVSVRPRHPEQDTAAQEAHKKRMARPVRKRFLRPDLSSLRQRIRPVGNPPAKMEIRAPCSP